ncbi:hypothetical protein B296_00053107 [Ensete ventricosum]|uniref:B box-type domain-containing protein n=1 Tax=Ensete ventricosum TaxID=4639 RepID=A0A426Y9K7_ENSVE|nr:hypothetical protein B296_00053107 [Ensete ventricosum]
MKIQCNACEAAEAAVLCCADEAALCWACDEKVHAANRLAGKHQRVPLLSNDGGGAVAGRSSSTASGVPKCDICQVPRLLPLSLSLSRSWAALIVSGTTRTKSLFFQEASGYFFCLEDRALLCRKCDLSIHTANSYVSAHQRFLLTGVRVGLESAESVPIANQQLHAAGKAVLSPSKQLPSSRRPMSSTETNAVPSSQIARVGGSVASISMSGIVPDWPFDEFFGFPDINQNGFEEHNASKVGSPSVAFDVDDMHISSTDEHCLVHRLTVESSEAMDHHHFIVLLTAIWMPTNAWASIQSTTGRCRKLHPHPRLQGLAGKETCFILYLMMLRLCLTSVLRLITRPRRFVHSVITVNNKNLGDDMG